MIKQNTNDHVIQFGDTRKIRENAIQIGMALDTTRFQLNKTTYQIVGSVFKNAINEVIRLAEKTDGQVNMGLIRAMMTAKSYRFVTPISADSSKDMSTELPTLPVILQHDIVDWTKNGIGGGLIALLGGTGSGKSYNLENVVKPQITIRMGEPSEHIDFLPGSYSSADLLETLMISVLLGNLGLTIAVDSFRQLVNGMSGAALKGGLSGSFYTTLTTINNFYSNFGVVIVGAINPMLADNAIPDLYNNVAASVSGSQLLQDKKITSEQYRTPSGRVIKKGINFVSSDEDSVQHYQTEKTPALPLDTKVATLSDYEAARITDSDMDHDDDRLPETRRSISLPN